MTKSQTAGWASDAPTPAQLKELFAQIDSGRITKDRLQGFLRGALQPANDDGDWFTFVCTDKSLQDLLHENLGIFYQKPWWATNWWAVKHFAKEQGQAGKRISIRLSAAPESLRNNWSEQQATLREGEFVPTARDLLEGVTLYYLATGKKLFTEYWVRTSTLSSNGVHIDLYWYPDGLYLYYDWDDSRYDGLGLAVARNS